MSKYTDMLTDKYRCYCGTCEVQKGNVSEEECEICSHYTIREALQMADRLEQAITDGHTADCIIVDVECVNNKHDKEVWLNGYNQALVDIRGDNNRND